MDIKEFLRGALTAPEKGDTVEYFNLKARVSGNVLTNAQRNIPSPGYTYEADITKFWEEFQNLKENCGYHLTFNTVMMKVLQKVSRLPPDSTHTLNIITLLHAADLSLRSTSTLQCLLSLKAEKLSL